MRKIVCAACRHKRYGYIICGVRHWDKLMHKQRNTYEIAYSKTLASSWEQGFVDNRGEFVSRAEAMQVAMEAGQDVDIERGCGGDSKTLYSEGLY